MKKILKLVLGLLLVGSMMFGATETAQVIITTSVGETTANSGIRVIETRPESFDTSQPVFDPIFFTSGSSLYLSTGKDSSLEGASGTFTVLVRRPVATAATLNVIATKMSLVGGTYDIPYTLTGTGGIDINMLGTDGTGTETATGSVDLTSYGSILRWFGDFTYTIPVSALAPLGTYSATITFSIEIT